MGATDDHEVDPLREKTDNKVVAAMGSLNYYSSIQALTESIAGIVMPTQKVLVLIDAPTSKVKVLSALLDKTAALVKTLTTKRIKIVTTVGSRLDLNSAIYNKCHVDFPTMSHHVVSLTHGRTCDD